MPLEDGRRDDLFFQNCPLDIQLSLQELVLVLQGFVLVLQKLDSLQ